MVNLRSNRDTKLLDHWLNNANGNLSYVIDFSKSYTYNKFHPKRSVLSQYAQIFDPLGLFSPIIISVKILIQILLQLTQC